MKTLHDDFMNLLKRIVPSLAADIIADKLSAQGISVSSRQKRRLADAVGQCFENEAPLRFHFRRWEFWTRRSLSIEFTPEEIQLLQNANAALQEKLPDLVLPLVGQLSERVLEALKGTWSAQAKGDSRVFHRFHKNLRKTWRQPLELLAMSIEAASQLGNALNQELRHNPPSELHTTIDLQTRLHARAVQVASEVQSLLNHGFADGAIARWRTLHEIAVTAHFLLDHGEAAAQRYLRHQCVELYRAANTYQLYCERLREEPIDEQEMQALRRDYDQAISEFGKDFTSPYGWAAIFLGNPNPTFADIERSVGFQFMRPHYKMASYNVHADPRGAFFRLGLVSEDQMLIAGPSDYGFADPGRNTCYSLAYISSALMVLAPTMDSFVAVQTLLTLAHEASNAFLETQFNLAEIRLKQSH